jgi:hypothetical protein
MTKARDLANGGFGLVLVKPSSVVNGTDNGKGTVSFSAQTSVSLNDVFSTTYDNYKLIFSSTSKNAVIVGMRMRVGGTDDTASNYAWALAKNAYTTSGSFDGAGSTYFFIGNTGSHSSNITIDIMNPFKTERTNYHGGAVQSPDTWWTGGTHTQNVSYTGLTILAASSTLTGSISVYGYNK